MKTFVKKILRGSGETVEMGSDGVNYVTYDKNAEQFTIPSNYMAQVKRLKQVTIKPTSGDASPQASASAQASASVQRVKNSLKQSAQAATQKAREIVEELPVEEVQSMVGPKLGLSLREMMFMKHSALIAKFYDYLTETSQNMTRRGVLVTTDILLGNNETMQVTLNGYNDAVCQCGMAMKSFYQTKCPFLLHASHPGWQVNDRRLKKCIEMFDQIDSKSPACVCPVDPYNGGTCGSPVNFDLQTGKRVSGLQIPYDETHQTRQLLAEDDNHVQVNGLSKPEQHRLKMWLIKTVRDNANIVDGKMVWEDVIPKEHGRYFRRHCDSLKWSVQKAGMRVEFHGLTFRVQSRKRRRRLLGRSSGGGC